MEAKIGLDGDPKLRTLPDLRVLPPPNVVKLPKAFAW